MNLPNYGDFEERKVFSPGNQVPVFRLQGYTVSVLICNDLWHPSLPYLAITQEADIIVAVINSSEEAVGDEFSNIESWEVINKAYARMFGIYLLCANRVGSETILTKAPLVSADGPEAVCPPSEVTHRFWGGSEVINPFGLRVAKAALHQEDAITVQVERDFLRRKRILLPYLRQDDPYFTLRELARILKDRDNCQTGPPGLARRPV